MSLTSVQDVSGYKGLSADSRAVKPGYLFAALPGSVADGRAYIADALARGAVAILAPAGTVLPEGCVAELIEDDNPRRLFALMASRFYGRQPDCIVAVSGTNGKSSAVFFAQKIWRALGEKAAFLGTLGVGVEEGVRPGAMTTPDPVALHKALADLADDGVTHLAMEASSHGLEQHRLDGVRISAGGFTSFSRDHMDYHGDMESYLRAKMRLFSDIVRPGGTAVLNADIPEFVRMEESCLAAGLRVLAYGHNGRDIRLVRVEALPEGQRLSLEVFGMARVIVLPLVGRFQAMNALCALGLVLAEDVHRAPEAVATLEKLRGAPGRLQAVAGHPQGAAVYVDYAHTPDALEAVLKALRPHTAGRLVCLFGCGGDRDTGKRAIMGEIAARLADAVVVTDDNPRSEDPAAIRAAVTAGAKAAKDIHEISGRREAIGFAVRGLAAGDVLLVAGKGHEQGQIFARITEPFDDVDVVQSVIMELGKRNHD